MSAVMCCPRERFPRELTVSGTVATELSGLGASFLFLNKSFRYANLRSRVWRISAFLGGMGSSSLIGRKGQWPPLRRLGCNAGASKNSATANSKLSFKYPDSALPSGALLSTIDAMSGRLINGSTQHQLQVPSPYNAPASDSCSQERIPHGTSSRPHLPRAMAHEGSVPLSGRAQCKSAAVRTGGANGAASRPRSASSSAHQSSVCSFSP